MKDKKIFEEPQLQIVDFECDDIITSSTSPDDPIIIDPWDDWDD